MKIPSSITVRTSSSRLPQKCLLPFGNGNVFEHIIRRAKHYNLVEGLKKIILPEQGPNQIKVSLTLDYKEDHWLLQTVHRILGNLTS